MAKEKKPLSADWKELQPTVYERRGFSIEESRKWGNRPKELIKSAASIGVNDKDVKIRDR